MTDTDRTGETDPSRSGAQIADQGSEFVPDTVAERATNARQRVVTTIEHSRLAALGARCRRYATSSSLYRWLTKEPEPQVIVIDLRETRTVGPFIRLLDAAIERLISVWRTSRAKALVDEINAAIQETPLRVGGIALAAATLANLLFTPITQSFSMSGLVSHFGLLGVAALGVRSSMTLDELLQNRIAQFLIDVFEPPEPPEHVETSDAEASDETGH